MKYYHWIFIVVLQVFISVLVQVVFLSQIKTVSLIELSSVGVQDIARALQRGEDPEELQRKQMQRLQQAQERLKNQFGIILLRECVVKGPFKDITNEVVR